MAQSRGRSCYNILIEFGIPMKLARLIKMCLSEICNKVRVGKHLSDMFPIKNGFVGAVGLAVSALPQITALERISTVSRRVGSVWPMPKGVVQSVNFCCHHM
jgi:hypothetical protein